MNTDSELERMTLDRDSIQERCDRLVRDHLASPGEASRHAAYELGREALDGGLGVLELAAVIARSMIGLLPEAGGTSDDDRPGAPAHDATALEGLVLDFLAPYEMAHRAVRDANAALRRGSEAREEELKRIAHVIHDEVGQLLVRVHWAIDDAARGAPAEAREKLRVAVERLQGVEDRLRLMAHELRPTILDDLGLEPALRTLADGVSNRTGVAVVVEGGTGERLPGPIETVLYRAAQEAVSNAIRHGRPRHIRIRLDRSGTGVACGVRDDGVGLPEGAGEPGARPGNGLGLTGIRERVAHVGGRVEILSAPNQGTEIFVTIPLKGESRAANPPRR
jgi:signal transduction histidine kinase